MSNQGCDLGLVGLGVMGRNLALNIADHGFVVAVYNRTPKKTREFIDQEIGERKITPGYTLSEFINLLHRPRALILLVSAGTAVDAIIKEMMPFLETGDLIIDTGNSHFTDTDRRSQDLASKGILFLGMGISGGESGARRGPSLMPGGPAAAYHRVQAVLEAAAAQVKGEPCVRYMGTGSAGHYVKMVHNGIEYGLMELIAESYDLLRFGLGMNLEELASIYEQWNQQELNSYLIEITARILRRQDDRSDKPLIDLILDQAKQKGTGMWCSQDAMNLRTPIPTIDSAVAMRDLSGQKTERRQAHQLFPCPRPVFGEDRPIFVSQLKDALFAAMIITYSQGLALINRASQNYNYGVHLEDVAYVWRGGCIIRAALLNEIMKAFQSRPDLPNLLLDQHFAREVVSRQQDLRTVVAAAAGLGLPVPALMVSLAYFDGYRRDRLPANLIQAQRDYFGAHTYERVDMPGAFHTQWEEISLVSAKEE